MSTKPAWPFPQIVTMFPCANGQWAKKIRGRRYYFGVWDDPKAALNRYNAEIHTILNGGQKLITRGLTIREMATAFLLSKSAQVKAGELSARMYDDYHRVCILMRDEFGADRGVATLTATDFAQLRAKMAPSKSRRANEITWTRTVFKWAYESDLLDRPAKFGPDFKRPKAGDIRKVKNMRGRSRLYAPDEVRKLVASASPLMKACILLAINAGMGNTDCSALTMADVDLDAGLIDTVRHKTGFLRTATLWPETVSALREWVKVRPKPAKRTGEPLFVTATGFALVRIETGPHPKHKDALRTVKVDAVCEEFAKLAAAQGLPGRTFYNLRHTFRTVAETGAFKERTISRIMGHVQAGIGTEYIHDFSVSKLQEVTDHVRRWYLTGHPPAQSAAAPASPADSPAATP